MITVQARDLKASKYQMRKQGLIPGIVYSKHKNVPITISTIEYDKARRAHEPVMKTSMGDMVIMKEVQRDPLTGRPLHVSFQHITKDQTFTTTIPLELKSTVNYSNKGLMLKTLQATVEVEATADTVVDHITVDVSSMEVHDVLRVKDLPQLKGIKYLDDEETQVAVLDYVAVDTEEAPDTKEATPELVKEKVEAKKD